jgi:plasmid rolling circle replication initiator protein Rep
VPTDGDNKMILKNLPPPIVNINYNINVDQSQELQKLAEHKRTTDGVTKDFYQFLVNNEEHTKAKRVRDCANFVTYRNYAQLGIKKLESINLCRERLCLNCQKALASERLPAYIYSTQGVSLRHITLTVKNVKGSMLRSTILTMKKALKSMLRSLKVKDYIPSYEITYKEADNTYHPHIHLLCKAENMTYKNTALKRLWAEWYNKYAGTKYPYLHCHNRLVDDNVNASLELCKYVSKPTSITPQTIPTLYNSLKGLHLHQANGTFKQKIAEYNGYTEAEREKVNSLLENYEYTIEQYLYNGENYIKIE